jgi:hypothetical protein
MFRLLSFAILVLCACAPADPPSRPARAALEEGIVKELNALRRNPPEYAAHIEERLRFYRGRVLALPGKTTLKTKEGAAAAREAIAVLRDTRPMQPLTYSEPLAQAARDHVRDIGPKGLVSHEGSGGGMSDRLRKRGAQYGYTAEAISFGPDDARSVVIDLIVDDGVKDRGHRKLLLESRFGFAGVGCGPHKVYGTMCVIDLGGNPSL